MKHLFTEAQKTALLGLAVLFIIDDAITALGALYWPGFLEANPLLNYWMSISMTAFLVALVLYKVIALGIIALMVYGFNWFKDSRQGDILSWSSVVLMAGAQGALIGMNITGMVP